MSTGTSVHRRDERSFYGLLGLGGLVVAVGLFAAHLMEEQGHIVTGPGQGFTFLVKNTNIKRRMEGRNVTDLHYTPPTF